ncbi:MULTISPECIES: phosphoglycerate dehydrogenase [Eubacteriales]|uniref:D-3-phosphoglycerate dehydrogenase n=1 Tax=Intestinimonas butyriciproducens TaxID=1297617 RepID=A0A2U1CG19_9FIRM|nr:MULTISPECIES: phosphoglycerate dehydrogenase [Eubacteriales]MCI6364785.1 phosphoglycerate dehydrogenase [Intestinimonas butyriciproducens]MCR1904713.1 phosphoglycerate dehydrogenase [Intestinimonas butyriciproducens]MDB7830166.1 phosphoglycerate dehydrogenase [Intestinimonas butyriciproducens]MDB7863478.1 phosphoglycerate dehydrogenase [Intestinimonas butyriciproducens]MDY3616938.1 phosphoglycerate dehydrogenase [Intestinimonas butyriciproducens]
MFRIKTLNQISPTGLSVLDASRFTVSDGVENEDGVLVRSADMQEYVFPPALRAIARAGAGTNNIPVDRCSESGIVVFNTPGANANAVKELAVCALMLASRDVVGGVEWVKAQARAGEDVAKVVEKGKSQFVGPEISGKNLGVIGLGAIGVQVANIATKLGMTVYGYDPFLSVDAALSLSRLVHHVTDLTAIYKNCDYITIHVPQTADTKGMLNAAAFDQMKTGVRVINLARGGLVAGEDMIAALESGKVARYVTDFPDNALTLVKNVVPIPHLGASSPESEENCALMAAQQLRDYLETGNIRNSVNLPTLEQDWSGETRLCIIHRNVPNMLASITAALSRENVNVENMTNKSKGNYAYTIVDVSARVGDAVADEIRAISGVLRVRVLRH